MATSSFSKVDEYGFSRPDDFNYDVYEGFMSKYLKVLATRAKKWSSLLKSGKSLPRSKTLKRYIRKGIPNEHRSEIWQLVSGVEALKREHGRDLYKKILDGPRQQDIVDTILTDLPRTFPDNIFFVDMREERPSQLYRILVAYSHHNKTVGYCQGMNYIAGLLLLVTKNEEAVFWLLMVLVEHKLPDYYSPTMSGVITDIDVLSELVRLKLPALHSHITRQGLPWPLFATKWFVCLYVDVLPVETVLRIWDCLFYEGSKILFRVAYTLIARHKDTLLSCQDFGSLAECFKGITSDSFTLYCHDFMESIFKVPGSFKLSTLERLRIEELRKREEREKLRQRATR
ncbi:growth hormone-regulated TBC protein 1-like [Macrosteles quadrilineatus]|uniref:growth hormone-regulated TBC protein 1-like n=1 Tax=Macrosteles quadrilineatus TaxID=74068 RepID=UPI0023E1FA7D|nr:growth hormone-regulated TBC protein 1-like [Macrosteles quadrilineatus]